MTKPTSTFTPRKTAVKALRALRKHAIDENLDAKAIATGIGIQYSTVWLWLGRKSANYNLTHLSEDMINLYLDQYKKEHPVTTPAPPAPEQLELPVKSGWYKDKPVSLKPNTAPWVKPPEKEPEDALLVMPKKEVLAIVSAGLNRRLLNGNYVVTGIEIKGDSGRILFREEEDNG